MTDKWTIYRTDNGEVTGVIESPDPETVALNIGEDEAAIPGDHTPGAYYVADGEALPLPPKPGPWAVWGGTEWTDPRTAEDHAAELQARRQAAVLTKLEFLQSAMAIGFLTPAEYRQGAKGEIPLPFVPVIQSLPPMDRDLAEGTWAGSTRVERLDPLILMVAQAANISDETLDLLFGVAAP